MAFAAVGQRLGDITATGGGGGQITGDHPIVVHEQQFPQTKATTQGKGKADVMRQAWRG